MLTHRGKYYGNGNGGFKGAGAIQTTEAETAQLLTGDLNNDGQIDVVASNMEAAGAFSGVFSAPPHAPFPRPLLTGTHILMLHVLPFLMKGVCTPSQALDLLENCIKKDLSVKKADLYNPSYDATTPPLDIKKYLKLPCCVL